MKYIDMDDFEEARRLKWKKSRAAMGLDPEGRFRKEDDAFEELYQELLDTVSYAEELERRHGLQLHAIKARACESAYAIRKFRRQVQVSSPSPVETRP